MCVYYDVHDSRHHNKGVPLYAFFYYILYISTILPQLYFITYALSKKPIILLTYGVKYSLFCTIFNNSYNFYNVVLCTFHKCAILYSSQNKCFFELIKSQINNKTPVRLDGGVFYKSNNFGSTYSTTKEFVQKPALI